MGVEVVNGGVAVEAEVNDPAALQNERAVEQREGVRRRAVDGRADADAAAAQALHHRYHLGARGKGHLSVVAQMLMPRRHRLRTTDITWAMARLHHAW